MTIETIIRPFGSPDVSPKPFVKPGTTGVADAHLIVGIKGGTKSFSTSSAASRSTAMGNAHQETAPASQGLQKRLAAASE